MIATIVHVGHGLLTNEGEAEPLEFADRAEAIQYLANCGELENLGTDWVISTSSADGSAWVPQ